MTGVSLRLVGVTLLLMLVLLVPVYAQESTAVPTAVPPETYPVAGVAENTGAEIPNGATTLVLLAGLGAVALVGFGTLLRQSYKPPQE